MAKRYRGIFIPIFRTKKRFRWNFRVNHKDYKLELASSTLSGKKVVTLNN